MAIRFGSMNVQLCACPYCESSYTLLILSCGDQCPVVALSTVLQARALMGRIPDWIMGRDSCRIPANLRPSGSLEPALLLSLPLCHPTLWHPPFNFVRLSFFSPLHAPFPPSLHSSQATLHRPFALFICLLMCWENKGICFCVTQDKTYDRAVRRRACVHDVYQLTKVHLLCISC